MSVSFSSRSAFGLQLAKSKSHSPGSCHRELIIAEALRIAQEDENAEDEAIGLEQLGDVYAARGLEDESITMLADLDQFILATALYNSSLLRIKNPAKNSELKSKLRKLEEDILRRCQKSINKDDFQYDVDKEHREKLQCFREQCREKLKSVQSQFDVFVSPLGRTDASSEVRRAKAIAELFVENQVFVKGFISSLLDECVEVLGPVPDRVNYAFIGFGSLARGQVTPFSDLEFALLVNEGMNTPAVKEYFVKLMEYFSFKVLNLQETILPSMCIPCLNDLNEGMGLLRRHKCTTVLCDRSDDGPMLPRDLSEDNRTGSRDASVDNSTMSTDYSDDYPTASGDWFYDDQMRGLSLDGRMSKACKTPLGCLVQGRGRNEDLIKTPSEMAELYVKFLENDLLPHPRIEDNYSLSTVLSNVTFIYGTDPGLVDIYDDLVLSLTEGPDLDTKLTLRQASAIGCLREALEEFYFSLNKSDIGLISSIKKRYYRVVDMLMMNLGKFQYQGVVDNTPWNILKRMADDGVINPDAFNNLLVLVGIVNEVRLMFYLRCGRQDELFSFFDQSTDINYDLAKDLFVRFFYTVCPLQTAIENFLSQVKEGDFDRNVLFDSTVSFYQHSPLNSAIAISITSYRYAHDAKKKFEEAFYSSDDENTRRLCLAFLSCLHPDYSTDFCDRILESSGCGSNSKWRIFSFLIAALASFHQDDIDKVKAFLDAATSESSLVLHSDTSGPSSGSRTDIVRAYEILVTGLLKLREKSYVEALDNFEEARVLYKTNMQSKRTESSLFVLCCGLMIGRCHLQLGHLDDVNIDGAMRAARAYFGNGKYMRILYHAYVAVLQGRDRSDVMAKHCEKLIELFLRFVNPNGQELWSSIVAQGAVLAALFLGLLYREMGRTDDALRVFRIAFSHVISKALEFCNQNCHVGTQSAEKVSMFVEAFKAIFKLLESECLHAKGCEQEMWSCLTEAVSYLAKYREKFEPIELREVLSVGREVSRGGWNTESAVWRSSECMPLAPRLVDAFGMAPLLEAWCDFLTKAMQYILYTMEQDIYGQLLTGGTILISFVAMLSSNVSLVEQFQRNPCAVLSQFIPLLRLNPTAGQMVDQIFKSASTQRKAVFEEVWNNVSQAQPYAVEFVDLWVELMILYLRLSLCHDLLSSSHFFK